MLIKQNAKAVGRDVQLVSGARKKCAEVKRQGTLSAAARAPLCLAQALARIDELGTSDQLLTHDTICWFHVDVQRSASCSERDDNTHNWLDP